MKIGVTCIIGHLDRYGYQYIYRDCIHNQAAFADRLYLVNAVRSEAGIGELLEKYPNIEYISDESVWPGLGVEGLDLSKMVEGMNVGLEAGIKDGMDCMILMCNNWYIPEPEALAERCREMLRGSSGWGWLYRKDQLAGTMFHASVRLPYIISGTASHKWGMDALHLQDGERIPWQHADWRAYDKGAVVDVPLEMPLGDLNAKLDYFHHDREKHGVSYSIGRFRKAKHISGESLSPTGLSIAANNQPEFVSNEVLRGLGYGE